MSSQAAAATGLGSSSASCRLAVRVSTILRLTNRLCFPEPFPHQARHLLFVDHVTFISLVLSPLKLRPIRRILQNCECFHEGLKIFHREDHHSGLAVTGNRNLLMSRYRLVHQGGEPCLGGSQAHRLHSHNYSPGQEFWAIATFSGCAVLHREVRPGRQWTRKIAAKTMGGIRPGYAKAVRADRGEPAQQPPRPLPGANLTEHTQGVAGCAGTLPISQGHDCEDPLARLAADYAGPFTRRDRSRTWLAAPRVRPTRSAGA